MGFLMGNDCIFFNLKEKTMFNKKQKKKKNENLINTIRFFMTITG